MFFNINNNNNNNNNNNHNNHNNSKNNSNNNQKNNNTDNNINKNPTLFSFTTLRQNEEGRNVKTYKDEDAYFFRNDDDDDDDKNEGETENKQQETIRGKKIKGLPSLPQISMKSEENKNDNAEEEEEESFDSFMTKLEDNLKKEEEAQNHSKRNQQEVFEREDHTASSFIQVKKLKKNLAIKQALEKGYDSDEEVYAVAKAVDEEDEYYDSETFDEESLQQLESGEKVPSKRFKKSITQLKPIDHSTVEYTPFEKNLYIENSHTQNLSEERVKSIRQRLDIHVGGFDPPKPVESFEYFGFDDTLIDVILNKQKFKTPTAIQSQSIPCIMSGRDVISIAKTGSGKTASFLWPMLMHIMHQEELSHGEGPIGLILTPTRELCQQIHSEAKKYSKPYGLRVLAMYGGASKNEQFKELRKGCDILVSTPGRLIDLLKMKACKLDKVTMVVLDEADRMFDLGFEQQMRTILNQIRPDRQVLLFSATFDPNVEKLAREFLLDPVRIVVGSVGKANEDVTQVVHIMNSEEDKWKWLMKRLEEFVVLGSVVIFVSNKQKSEDLATKLCNISKTVSKPFTAASIHGDKSQEEREEVITAFKSGIMSILVATDVASRGLDISSIKTVINYDIAKDIDIHTHRIGRTGRAGDKLGVAHTLMIRSQGYFAPDLVRNLEQCGQYVEKELMDLALMNHKFKRQRCHKRMAIGSKSRLQKLKTGTSGLAYQPTDTPTSDLSTSSYHQQQPIVASTREQVMNQLKAGVKSSLKQQFRSYFVPSSSKQVDSGDSSSEQKKSKFVIIQAKKPQKVDRNEFIEERMKNVQQHSNISTTSAIASVNTFQQENLVHHQQMMQNEAYRKQQELIWQEYNRLLQKQDPIKRGTYSETFDKDTDHEVKEIEQQQKKAKQ